MSATRKVYFFVGCLLTAVGVGAMVEGCGKRQAPPPASSSPVETVVGTNTNTPTAEVAQAPSATPLPDPYFRLTIQSNTDIEQTAEHEKTDNEVELKYAHQKTNDGIILFFYSVESKKHEAGALAQDVLMTRDELVNTEGKEKAESSFDELSQKWQAALAGTFARGLCKITLDTNQNELVRQMLSPGGMGLVGTENLDMVRLMHGPYRREADRWPCTNSVPTTYAFVIHCPVTYARMGGTNHEIKMEGSFTNDAIDSPPDGVEFKNVSCNFAGRESFDQMAGEYTSGEAAFEYKFRIVQGGVEVATLDRHVKLTLEQITTRSR